MDGSIISRRAALGTAAALLIGVRLANAQSGAASAFRPAQGGAAPFAPNAFIRVGTDDTVTVIVKHIEFGQGPFTGLATLVAEEMDADWSQMRAEHAPANQELYKNLTMGIQGTGGSSAIANSFDQMRQAAAAARVMLVQAAAAEWRVAPGEITLQGGVLRHASGREGRFGSFAAAAAQLPVPADPPLKPAAEYRLVGRENTPVRRLDTAAKSNGSAVFTIDLHAPGMLTVLVAHPPRFGAKPAGFNADAARRIAGVVDVQQISSGIAVYAEGFWAAHKGREALRIDWDESAAERRGTEQLLAEYRALSLTPGRRAGSHGDAEAVLAQARQGHGQLVEAEFVFPYLAHAPMEPLDGVLDWDGSRAHARFGSQLQTGDHAAIAQVLGLPQDRVTIETMIAGGSFGRRAQPSMHLAVELAEIAKAIGPGRPVKLVWTREDDLRGGYYRPFMLHRMRGAVRDGRIVALADTVVGQSILKGSPFEMMIRDGVDATSVEGARETPYEIADFSCDLHTTHAGVPVLWWRSVGHTHTGYAIECFVDALLEAAGQDPVAGRLAMMGRAPRAAGVLRAVAQLAGWQGPGPFGDRARGVAVVESFGTHVAQIAEVSAGPEGVRVHRVWCAVDCGVAVNPDVIRAQIEGGVGYGLGHALHAEVALDAGRVVPGNFDTYRSLRIEEMPEVIVTIVASTEKPTGVGEPGLPPTAPAVANAMARLGLGRPGRLPFNRVGIA